MLAEVITDHGSCTSGESRSHFGNGLNEVTGFKRDKGSGWSDRVRSSRGRTSRECCHCCGSGDGDDQVLHDLISMKGMRDNSHGVPRSARRCLSSPPSASASGRSTAGTATGPCFAGDAGHFLKAYTASRSRRTRISRLLSPVSWNRNAYCFPSYVLTQGIGPCGRTKDFGPCVRDPMARTDRFREPDWEPDYRPCTKSGIPGRLRATLGPLPGFPTHPITPSSVIGCNVGPFLRLAEDSCNPGGDRPDRTVKQASTHRKDNAVPHPVLRMEPRVFPITGSMPRIRSLSSFFLPNDGNFRPLCRIIS